MKRKTVSSPRQRGFSILEILVATVLISSLIASGIYYINLGSKASLVNVAAVKNVTAVRFPEALIAIYSRKQSFTGTANADLIETGSVQANVPVTWSIASGSDAPTKDTLKLNLTFTDEKEAEILKDYLLIHKDSLMVTDAVVSKSNNKLLLITYKVS